jgi:GNAT superfamily N-acetyltransferase
MQIRRYTDGDQAAVIRLHNEALAATGAHLGPGPWDEDLERIEKIYLRRGGEFLVATVDDEVVAMGALRRVSERVAEIKRMRTASAHQRRGLGREVLLHLERRAVELGYRRLCLDTTDKQAAAQHLYTSAGYQETHREPGPGIDENLIYEKRLDPDL